MPSRNSATFNKSRAITCPSITEHILPLPYRIFNETNRMWYNAKLKIDLWLMMIHALLESQVGVLEHFRVMGWDSLVTMTGDYYPNLVIKSSMPIFSLNLTRTKLTSPVLLKGLGFILIDQSFELRETTSASDVIKEATVKQSHYWWDENKIRYVGEFDMLILYILLQYFIFDFRSILLVKRCVLDELEERMK
ncbi:hypothetical protein M9H77_17954 [Catharanthus roseus]|uniref:Uncharacterized protein n=1 Tax=Catharanthus roseus TaxID=4058 RepID=A0ACC0B620_CATRO|nr:hypothetical protein M9H77_17954 [Catharanthus roseus]